MALQIIDAVANNGKADQTPCIYTSQKTGEMTVSSGFDYEVFLSFRGPDTRAGFTDFLYVSLIDAGIHAYRDDEELQVGEEIKPKLLQAIEQSRISIPIFSKRYASSTWCLMELVQMVECKKNMGQKIMPIFYDMEPSEVRHQTGGYGQAFIEHESKGRYSDETISLWKAALSEVGALKGWNLHSIPNRREGDFVKTLIKKVLRELKKGCLALSDCLVEVDNHVSEIMRMIGPQTRETLVIGIYGMGGVGKTTLAKIIYNQLSHDFEHHCFLSNIRETWKVNGAQHLQNRLICDILKGNCKDKSLSDTDEGIEMIKQGLRGKRLLLLLDDVDQNNQLNALMGKRDWFGEGSKVIITTRNKQVLNIPEVDWTYELKCMDLNKSLQLFSKHAFRRDHPLDDYLAHSKKAVDIAGGLPLALEVIGSLLSCNSREKWDAILNKLEKIPPKEVSSKLKISYEELDDRQQHIFLDIACLLIGYDKEMAIHLWDETEYFPEEALEVLQHMSLIKIDIFNTLWMHDLLRDMGREIICQDSNRVIEKQSRVWRADEASNLLMTNQEKEKIEALRLEFRYLAGHRLADKAFMRLPNLRFLVVNREIDPSYFLTDEDQKDLEIMFESVTRKLQQNFHLLTNFFGKKSHILPKLRWLTWNNIPLYFDITKLSMKNLVILNLAGRNITHRWHGWSHIKMAKSLKVLNISNNPLLVETPDFLGFENLERLIMQNCIRLARVDESIGQLELLVCLDLKGCWLLRHLPDEIYRLRSLKEFFISDIK